MNKSESKWELVNDLTSATITVIYNQAGVYHIQGTNLFLSKQEYHKYLGDVETVILLPDNGRCNIKWP